MSDDLRDWIVFAMAAAHFVLFLSSWTTEPRRRMRRRSRASSRRFRRCETFPPSSAMARLRPPPREGEGGGDYRGDSGLQKEMHAMGLKLLGFRKHGRPVLAGGASA